MDAIAKRKIVVYFGIKLHRFAQNISNMRKMILNTGVDYRFFGKNRSPSTDESGKEAKTVLHPWMKAKKRRKLVIIYG